MSKVKARRPYDASKPTSITFPETTMAKQAFKDECDINTIMSKYQKTGLIEHVQKVQGSYGDFLSVQDYQLSLNQVIEAQAAFDALPSRVRERFANDPSRLMSFLQDEKNQDEAIRLGLVVAPEPPQAPPAAPATPQPSSGAAPAATQAASQAAPGAPLHSSYGS
ncbi:internal scaffolding protein [robinz microvirus RP_160]|nr:internal scaffolding protein [robinz microvirus RP_160]